MSGEAVGWAFRKVQMDDATAKFVLVAICNYANENDEAWPSHAAIARVTGLSKRSIQNGIKKLEDWGLIRRQRREREDGSETSARVVLDLDVSWVVKGGVATPATPDEAARARRIAGDSSLETTTKPKKDSSRAKKDVNARIEYSEEFETQVWQKWPRSEGSKKKAYDYWNMLNEENRARVIAAVPAFAERMKREGRPNEKIPHLTSWFNGREWETTAPVAARAGGAAARPFWETASRQDWINALQLWAMNWNWRKEWGPEPENPMRPNPPGSPKHHVPQDILDRFDLRYRGAMYSPEQKAEIQARVDAASKHAVDKVGIA